MTKNYTYKDLFYSIIIYLIILLVSGYFKYDIIYNRLIDSANENIFSTIFLTSNIITSIVAVIFLIIIIYLVKFTVTLNDDFLSKNEFLYGTTMLVFTLAFFELLKFAYLILDLDNQIRDIAVDVNFMEYLKEISFVKHSNILNYLSYLVGSVIFILVIGIQRKKIESNTILTGFTFFVFLAFIQYVF